MSLHLFSPFDLVIFSSDWPNALIKLDWHITTIASTGHWGLVHIENYIFYQKHMKYLFLIHILWKRTLNHIWSKTTIKMIIFAGHPVGVDVISCWQWYQGYLTTSQYKMLLSLCSSDTPAFCSALIYFFNFISK